MLRFTYQYKKVRRTRKDNCRFQVFRIGHHLNMADHKLLKNDMYYTVIYIKLVQNTKEFIMSVVTQTQNEYLTDIKEIFKLISRKPNDNATGTVHTKNNTENQRLSITANQSTPEVIYCALSIYGVIIKWKKNLPKQVQIVHYGTNALVV